MGPISGFAMGWPALSVVAHTLQKISKVVFAAVIFIFLAQAATAELSGDCIHDCKKFFFKGKNSIFTNGACAVLCVGVKLKGVY